VDENTEANVTSKCVSFVPSYRWNVHVICCCMCPWEGQKWKTVLWAKLCCTYTALVFSCFECSYMWWLL